MSARAESQTVYRAAAVAVVLLSLIAAQPAVAVAGAPDVRSSAAEPSSVGGEDADTSSVDRPSADASSISADASIVDSAAAGAPAADAAATSTIEIETALSLTPDHPGSIGVVQRFDPSEAVTELRVTLDPESAVTESEGFNHVNGQTWEWDGETSEPQLRYEMAVNRTTASSGPLGADGRYLYADVGSWALVRQPNIGLQWRYRGTDSISVDRSTRVDGEGTVGEVTAFLGPHEVHTRDVAGQEIRLIVPDAADLEDDPERVLDGLGNASRAMQVGDRDPTVFAIAAPTDGVDWAVQGVQIGDADFWVRASQPVDEIGSAWLHEYVHTRQAFRTADSGWWFTEASATWYAALLSHQLEGASFADFAGFLDRGTVSPQAGSVLADPTDWENNANYWKGALVAGELDRRIRLATDHGATLQRVIASLNDRTTPITNGDILSAVGNASTESTRDTAERLTTTSDRPEVWNRSAHREAFGGDAALFRVRFDPATDVRATGPYRNATVADPVTLATGETLSVRTKVANLGGVAGEYAVTLRVDDDAVATANGTLDPDERSRVTLAHEFTDPGSYVVSVAGERFTVEVREPATPTVTDVSVDRSTVKRGDEVTVTATVRNNEAVPGNATVSFTRDAEKVGTESVTVGPGKSEMVTATVLMDQAGDHRVGAGSLAVDVHVDERPRGGPGTSSTTSPGFGVPAAVAAVAGSVALWRRISGE